MERHAEDRHARAEDERPHGGVSSEATTRPLDAATNLWGMQWPLAGLLVHVVLVVALLARADGNPQFFVHFGQEGSVVPMAKRVLGDDILIPHVDGHDGQAFWLLARDPLLVHGKEFLAPYLDRPTYRAQRIGYPLLAAPWRLGGETALLWGLLATNLAVILVGGLVARSLVAHLGGASRGSLAFALCPGVLLATLFSLSDALALALLLATALAMTRRRIGVAVACGVLAALTKESALLGLAGFAFLTPRLPARTRALLFAAPAAAAAAWALYVRWRLGWQVAAPVHELAPPFWGYLDAFRRGWSPIGNWSDAFVAFALVPFAVFGIGRWWSRRTLLLAGGVPFLLLVPFLSAGILDLANNSLRAVTPSLTLMVLDYYAELGGDRA